AVDAEDRLPGPDNGAQAPNGKRQRRLLPDLTHGSLRIVLAILDSTTDGEPPSCPWTARITAAQQEQTIVAVHQENTGSPPLRQRHEPRCFHGSHRQEKHLTLPRRKT